MLMGEIKGESVLMTFLSDNGSIKWPWCRLQDERYSEKKKDSYKRKVILNEINLIASYFKHSYVYMNKNFII